jgi:uncharacterized protein (TIGR02246 family)
MRFCFRLVAIAQIAITVSLAAQGKDLEADKEAIGAILKEAVAAHRAGDAQRWAAIFTSDAVMMPANRPTISGREALLRYARELFTKFTSRPEIKPVEIEVSGDWAFGRTAVTGTMTPKDGGAPLELDWKEIAIYRRQADGSWKVARLIGNSNRAPAESRKE